MQNKQVKIWTDPDIAAAFKIACTDAGVSMASELTNFMAERTTILKCAKDKDCNKITSRGGRRKEVATIVIRLEKIRDAEDTYKDNIPENLRNGIAYESAEQTVEAIDQAIEILQEAF